MIRSMIKKALGRDERPSETPTPSPGPARSVGGGLVQVGRKPSQRKREGLPRRGADEDVQAWYEAQIAANPVLVFMKGTPSAPACGFSATVAEIMKSSGVPFQTYNILEDQEVRQGIKQINNWPTIPQIVIGGEFMGGCDIVTQMHQSGELADALKAATAAPEADGS